MKYFLTIFILLFPLLLNAQMVPFPGPCNAVGSSCNPATDEVGARSENTGGANIQQNNIYCQGPYTPDCSGTLGYGYSRKYNDATTGSESVKVCVYLDDGDDAADSGDTKVACEIATSAEEASTGKWFATTNKLGGSVSTANKYWVCVISAQTSWTHGFNTSGSFKRYTKSDSSYSTPPDNLDGLSSADTESELDAYVGIE